LACGGFGEWWSLVLVQGMRCEGSEGCLDVIIAGVGSRLVGECTGEMCVLMWVGRRGRRGMRGFCRGSV